MIGLCVIDLDTVMSGYFISDLGTYHLPPVLLPYLFYSYIGDMFRSYLPTSNEEHTNLQDVTVRIEYFTEIIRGYLEEMHTSLTSQEYEYLIYAGEFMIYMQCLRFLTDYLKGDLYFKITHPMHNYDRARNQLQLLSSYREQAPVMKEIVQQCISQIHNKDDEIIIE